MKTVFKKQPLALLGLLMIYFIKPIGLFNLELDLKMETLIPGS